MTKNNKYKEFVDYFDDLDARGISYGSSDLKEKAKELNLPIPVKIDGKLYFNLSGVDDE